jgi:hypothetical protein
MTNSIKLLLKRIEPWQVLAALVVSIGLGLLSAKAWVHSEAKDAVLDEKFLATLSARVRPTCIFNSRGAIEADAGAAEYIEDIRVIQAPQIYGYEVVIKAKRHLAYPPMVSGLDVALFPQSETRGKMHDWDIVLAPQITMPALLTEEGPGWTSNTVHRFKLEILH